MLFAPIKYLLGILCSISGQSLIPRQHYDNDAFALRVDVLHVSAEFPVFIHTTVQVT
jgi:hypothetical protein